MNVIRALWAYRGFILGSIKREFQVKYRNSLLGAAWNVINPLSMIVVYTVIFSEIMKARLPGVDSTNAFGIYLCAGILTWGMFAEITNRCTTMFIDNANLLKKLSFPRLCLPVVVVSNALLNFSIVFALFLTYLMIVGQFPGTPILALIPLIILQVAFSIGLGITLGMLNVFFRDVGQFFGIFLTFWFWFTPIVYPASILPTQAQILVRFNPMARLIAGYQEVLVFGRWPNWTTLWPVVILSVLLCTYGLYLFRSRSGEMIDEL